MYYVCITTVNPNLRVFVSALMAVALDDFTINIVDVDIKRIVRKFSGHRNRITDMVRSWEILKIWKILKITDMVRSWEILKICYVAWPDQLFFSHRHLVLTPDGWLHVH